MNCATQNGIFNSAQNPTEVNMFETIIYIGSIANIIVSIVYSVWAVLSVYLFIRFYRTLKHIRTACQLYVAKHLQLKEKAKQIREEFNDASIAEIADVLDVDVIIVEHWLEDE